MKTNLSKKNRISVHGSILRENISTSEALQAAWKLLATDCHGTRCKASEKWLRNRSDPSDRLIASERRSVPEMG